MDQDRCLTSNRKHRNDPHDPACSDCVSVLTPHHERREIKTTETSRAIRTHVHCKQLSTDFRDDPAEWKTAGGGCTTCEKSGFQDKHGPFFRKDMRLSSPQDRMLFLCHDRNANRNHKQTPPLHTKSASN